MLTIINGTARRSHHLFGAGKAASSQRWLLRSLALMLLLGILLPTLLSPIPAYACSCAGPETVEAALQSKSHIFTGTVTKIDKRSGFRLPWGSVSSGDPVAVTFNVSEIWKGGPDSQVTVRTALGSESCGIDTFQVGQPYLVYAREYMGKLSTNICERTKPLASAADDLHILGPGTAPTQQSSDAANLPPAAGWAAALLILAVAVALLVVRRRRRR